MSLTDMTVTELKGAEEAYTWPTVEGMWIVENLAYHANYKGPGIWLVWDFDYSEEGPWMIIDFDEFAVSSADEAPWLINHFDNIGYDSKPDSFWWTIAERFEG